MSKLIIPTNYKTSLSIFETQQEIKNIKDFFQVELAKELNLYRVTAPLFVLSNTGINDNLNGYERAISFDVLTDKTAEIVHSLAKWKRIALKNYNFLNNTGLYTDMNAIRKDEELDNIHSYYVDQWDWELIIDKKDRTIDKLKEIVNKIYRVLLKTEEFINTSHNEIQTNLSKEIYFITAQELENIYPDLTPKERENEICKKFGSVFIIGIGKILESGKVHDGRSPDYDDWNLNGDLLVWNNVLDSALELSSMGIRVNKDSLIEQLKISGNEDRLNLDYHRMILNNKLPFTIGGGIGQSRLCMFFLQKAHIGEVQVSLWPEEMREECKKGNIDLL